MTAKTWTITVRRSDKDIRATVTSITTGDSLEYRQRFSDHRPASRAVNDAILALWDDLRHTFDVI